jgi:glycosyltransferase involved in cell wall biosynthesis
MGGIEEVRRKLNDSYTDESYNTKGVQNNLEKRFGNKDYLGRSQFKFSIDETELPRFIIENKEKYKKLLKPTLEDMGKGNIDVIIPVYNGAEFILDALNSVARQTLSPNKIIVVDDGSTDNTNELVSHFAQNSKIEVQIIKKENGGLSSARNAGIKTSRALFVAFLDADDVWIENKLEEQVRVYANSNFDHLGLVYCDYDVIDISGNIKFKNYKSPLDKKRMRGMVFDRLLERNKITSSGSGVLIKREVFNTTGLFDEKLKFGEDWDMWLRISQKYEVDFSEKILVHIRKHENNMTARQTKVFGNELYFYNKWTDLIKGKKNTPLFWADKITFRIVTHLSNKNFRDNLKNSISEDNQKVIFRYSLGSVYLYIPIFLVRQVFNLIFSSHYLKIAINFIKHKGV